MNSGVKALMLATALLAGGAGAVFAGEADVLDAKARHSGGGVWSFDVTIRHADTGWDHYADNFEVLGPGGALLARRILYHPHVDEQPFTRSVSGVSIPADVKNVRVRAHDKIHGYGGRETEVELKR